MNFNKIENQINLFLLIFIVIYQSFDLIKLPHNINNILIQPLVLVLLIMLLIFLIKNKTTLLLIIILYFVIILKSKNIESSEIESTEIESNEESNEMESNEMEFEEEFDKMEKKEADEFNKIKKKTAGKNNNIKKENNIYDLLNNEEQINQNIFEEVEDISQNENIISNVSKTQLDKAQGDDYNYCK